MRSILTSVSPKDCELIADDKKEILVQKTCPIVRIPFKCYIYCTEKDYEKCFYQDKFMHKIFLQGQAKGKVIGEFVCDEVDDILCLTNGSPEGCGVPWYREVKGSCLTTIDLMRYGAGKPLYGWHISDLKIYDKPKELNEFSIVCDKYNQLKESFPTINEPNECQRCRYSYTIDCYRRCRLDGRKELSRPPHPWCYVEDLEG